MALTAFAAEADHAAATAEHAAEGGSIHVVLKAEEIGHFLGLPITNSLLLTWITMAVLILFAVLLRRKLALIPGKLQAGIEWLFEGVLNYMTETLEDEKL